MIRFLPMSLRWTPGCNQQGLQDICERHPARCPPVMFPNRSQAVQIPGREVKYGIHIFNMDDVVHIRYMRLCFHRSTAALMWCGSHTSYNTMKIKIHNADNEKDWTYISAKSPFCLFWHSKALSDKTIVTCACFTAVYLVPLLDSLFRQVWYDGVLKGGCV